MHVDVTPLARERALANGPVGAAWLTTLPDVVARLAAKWRLDIGATFTGGTAGYVAEARDSSGRKLVVKVAMPLDADEIGAFRRSVRSHELADGRGCARLVAHDDADHAMLLERLGPNLDELGFTVDTIQDVVSETLSSFWRPVTVEDGLRTGADQAHWLADFVVRTWEELGHPCPDEVVASAVEYCGRRADAFDPGDVVLVHGDAHGWNTLDAGDGRFAFVDPEGLASEPAHDLAVLMREYNEPLLRGDTARLTRQRAERLASRGDVDPEAVWQWGFVERVSTGLAGLRDFGEAEGRPFLDVAQRCLA